MIILDENNNTPNVLHFHGQNGAQLPITFNAVANEHIVNIQYDRKKLSIVSCWTDDEQCCLLHQCQKFGIPLDNVVPDDYDRTQTWYMPNKIKFFLDYLQNKCNTELVMFLDGYDVLFTSLSEIIPKFKRYGFRILFNPSCNNYPNIFIDRLYNRQNLGLYRYFNAGCCIGYREDLIKFYSEALEHINEPNPWNSEQLVLRYAFKKYANDPEQRFVGIDYKCTLFKSMGCTNSTINDSHTEIIFEQNRMLDYNVVSIGLCDISKIDINREKCKLYNLNIDEDENILYGLYQLFDINEVHCNKEEKTLDKIKDYCNRYNITLIIH